MDIQTIIMIIIIIAIGILVLSVIITSTIDANKKTNHCEKLGYVYYRDVTSDKYNCCKIGVEVTSNGYKQEEGCIPGN